MSDLTEQRRDELVEAIESGWEDELSEAEHELVQMVLRNVTPVVARIIEDAERGMWNADRRRALIAEAEAEAWDEGYEAGDQDARAVNPAWPGRTRNPHRL